MPLKACQYKHSTNTTKTHYKSHKTHKPNPPQHLSRNQGTRAVRRGSDARVHYQLNNTQEAHPGHPHIHAGPDKHLHREPTRSLQPDISKLNSVPTRPHQHQPEISTPTTHRQQAVLTQPAPTRPSIIDDSTSEHHQCPSNRRRGRGVRAP